MVGRGNGKCVLQIQLVRHVILLFLTCANSSTKTNLFTSFIYFHVSEDFKINTLCLTTQLLDCGPKPINTQCYCELLGAEKNLKVKYLSPKFY